jgi:TPR repeat protein
MPRLKQSAGNSEAQFRLGAYYHDAVEMAPDYQTAALWFRRAAEQGHAAAQFALGEMYLNAEGMLPDEVQAAKWIQKAAEQGYAPAQNETGRHVFERDRSYPG